MEKKIKFGCVAWGLPGGGYFGPQIAKEAGLDGIQLELGSYEWGYPLAQKQVQEAYLEEGNRLGIEYPSIVLNDVMDHEFIHGKDTENGKIAYDQMELAVQVAAEIGISTGSGKSTRRNTMPVSGWAGRSVNSTRWPLCRPTPTAREIVLMVRC